MRAEVGLTKEGKAIVDAFDRFHEKYDELITNGLDEMLADIKNNISNS